MKKVLITLMLAVLAVCFAAVPAFAELNPDDVPDDAVMYQLDMDNYSVYVDFESGFATDDYTHELGDMGIEGISFMDGASYAKIVEGEQAISGNCSFNAKGYLDARIWSLSLLEGEGDYIIVEVKFKAINMDGRGCFMLCYNEPDVASTGTESNGGWLYKVQKVDDKLVATNRANKVMAELEEGRTYTLAAAFSLGEKYYDFFVDGVRVATENKWLGPVSGLCGFRIDMAGPGWDQHEANAANTLEWVMDDLIITYGSEITKAEYFATPTPTPEPTPEPTATPESTATPTSAPTAEPKAEEKGCKTVVVSASVVSAMTLLAAAVVLKKKH